MPEAEVYILLVEVGRSAGDGLPDDATGAAFLCYATGRDGRCGVSIESYGTGSDREGLGIGDEERALMDRARAENAVVVASVEHFTEEKG